MSNRESETQQSLLKRLKQIDLAASSVASFMFVRGVKNPFYIEGISPLIPESVVIGPAVTVKYEPLENVSIGFPVEKYRESAIFKACDIASPGDVVVLGAMGSPTGVIGDCIALGFKVKGAQGVVIDGGLRDSYWIKNKHKFPVFARCITALGAHNIFPTRLNIPIKCADVLVKPGDIIVADDDGVVVVPPHLLKDAVEYAEKEMKLEMIARKKMVEGLPKGTSLGQLYPPKEEWLEEER